MSDRLFTVKPSALLTVALSTTAQALGLSVPSTLHDVKVCVIGCEPNGTSSTAPKLRVQLVQTSNQPDGGTAVTPAPNDKKAGLTSKVTAYHTPTWSGGTGTEVVLWEGLVHPQAGYPWKVADEGFYIPGGTGCVLRVINTSGSAGVDYMPRLVIKE